MEMRILAISDIHNNVACVRKLRAQERNIFDVIAIPGDIGGERAAEIFSVLNTFCCPIVYVCGNWDHKLTSREPFGERCHLLHFNVVQIGGFFFTGCSWLSEEDDALGRAYWQSRADDYRSRLAEAMRHVTDHQKTIVLTHDRPTLMRTRLPKVRLFLFGHRHVFDVSVSKGAHYVNVSALDRLIPVVPETNQKISRPDQNSEERYWFSHIGEMRYVNGGNYCVIEITESGEVNIDCRILHHWYPGWKFFRTNTRWFGVPLVPEEGAFGDNVRFPKEKSV
jgi:predicted phosphodiesterase